MKCHWAIWAVLFVAAQASVFFGFELSDAQYSVFYLTATDMQMLSLSLFAFSVCPWHLLAAKMAAFSFVIWSMVCLTVNGILEIFNINQPYEAATVFAIVATIIAFGCLRFLLWPTQNTTKIQQGHIYLIISRPKTITGALALIISGVGGAFSVWSEKENTLYKYVRDDGASVLQKTYSNTLPMGAAGKSVIDMGYATDEIMGQLNSKVGSKWSIFNNCLQLRGLSGERS